MTQAQPLPLPRFTCAVCGYTWLRRMDQVPVRAPCGHRNWQKEAKP